jgi:hypothetical protein
MQNEYLFKKLAKIYVSPSKSKSKEIKIETEPPIMINTKRKWDLLKITQENTSLTKRLIDSKTSYNYRTPISELGLSRTKFNFKPNQKTKSSLSLKDKEKRGDEINLDMEFEELKSKTNQNFFGLTGFSLGERITRRNFTAGLGFYRFEKKSEFDEDVRKTKFLERDNMSNGLIILDSPFKNKSKEKKLNSNNSFSPLNPIKKIIYTRKAFLPKLSLVNIEFYSQYKKLFLLIEPISIYSGKLFMIIFEKIEDLHLLKSAYKNYENIINDLEFDGQNILIKNDKSDLVYV